MYLIDIIYIYIYFSQIFDSSNAADITVNSENNYLIIRKLTATLGLNIQHSPNLVRSNDLKKVQMGSVVDGLDVDSDEIHNVDQLKAAMYYVYDPQSDINIDKTHKFYGSTKTVVQKEDSDNDDDNDAGRGYYRSHNEENVYDNNQPRPSLSVSVTTKSTKRSRSDLTKSSTTSTGQNAPTDFLQYLSVKYGSPDRVNVQLKINFGDQQQIEAYNARFPNDAMGKRWLSVILCIICLL